MLEFFLSNIPQILMLVLLAVYIWWAEVNDGKVVSETVSLTRACVFVLLMIGLLVWGGFFPNLFSK